MCGVKLSSKLNQHFVPKYLFRLYSGGREFIHLVSKRASTVALNAPIRHQCARNKYYGSREIESILEEFDRFHSSAIRSIVAKAEAEASPNITPEERRLLDEALSLQHNRTPRRSDNTEQSEHLLHLYSLQQFALSLGPAFGGKYILDSMRNGTVEVSRAPLRIRLGKLRTAVDSAPLLGDLRLAILENETSHPFVLGDSPCIFCNRYLYDIRLFPTLKYDVPGVIVLMPVGRRRQCMLYDADVYSLGSEDTRIVLRHEADVLQLNALQIHSAKECVYFADSAYATTLVRHIDDLRPAFIEDLARLVTYPPRSAIIEGQPCRGHTVCMFEAQLPIRLELSFMKSLTSPYSDSIVPSPIPDLRRAARQRPFITESEIKAYPAATIRFRDKPKLNP